MSSLPIPKKRPTFLASIILIIIVFGAYYPGGEYQKILSAYRERLYSNPPQVASLPLPELGRNAKLHLAIYLPKYVANFGERWIYFSIKYSIDETDNVADSVIDSSKLWVNPGSDPESLENKGGETLLFPYLFKNNIYVNGANIGKIYPNSQVSGRIPVESTSEKDVQIDSIWFQGKAGDKIVLGEFGKGVSWPPIEFNKRKALLHSLVETFLLPPWSNGLIPALVLLVGWLIENRFYEDEEEPRLDRNGLVDVVKISISAGGVLWCFFSLGYLLLGLIPLALWLFFVFVVVVIFWLLEPCLSALGRWLWHLCVSVLDKKPALKRLAGCLCHSCVATSVSTAQETQFVFCPKCGGKNYSNYKFCTKCGAPLPPIKNNPTSEGNASTLSSNDESDAPAKQEQPTQSNASGPANERQDVTTDHHSNPEIENPPAVDEEKVQDKEDGPSEPTQGPPDELAKKE